MTAPHRCSLEEKGRQGADRCACMLTTYRLLVVPEAPGTAAAETGLKPQAADKMAGYRNLDIHERRSSGEQLLICDQASLGGRQAVLLSEAVDDFPRGGAQLGC